MADNGSDPNSTQSQSRWKNSKTAAGLRAAGSSLSDSGRDEMDRASSESIRPVSYKKGGRVKRTGLARLHKGEYVVPRNKVKRVVGRMKARR